jgi:outer membrane receptor protein involved in Fe transport
MRNSTTRATLLAAAAACLPAAGWADEAPVIEEVIVTALKRETTLDATPLAVTAISSELLEELGARDFNAYFQKAPGLVAQDSGSGRKRYVIRGVNNQGSGLTQATVAQYLDEVPITDNFNQQPDPYLVDIERVEILRGPQGTLFGARSMSGTVRTITRKPNLERFEAKGTAILSWTKYGGRNENLEAIVNAPLSDTLAVRASAFYADEEGYIDNDFAGGTFRPVPSQLPPGVVNPAPITLDPVREENFTDVAYSGARGAVRLQPSDTLTLDVTSMVQKGEVGGAPSYDPTATGNERKGLVTAVVGNSGNDDKLWISSITANYEMDWATATAVAAYTDRNNFVLSAAQAAGALFGGGPGSTVTFGADTESWAFEARLASPDVGAWQWITGLYVFSQDRNGRLVDFVGFGNFTVQNVNFVNASDEYALFGELSYAPTDALTLTVGARSSDYKNTLHRFFIVPPPNSRFAANTADPNPPRFDEKSTTLKFEANYDFSDDALVYVMAAQGFRPGGFNPNAAEFAAVPDDYDSDSIWSYEIGAKSTWLERRLSARGALYRIDWDDIQGEGFTPNPFGPGQVSYTTNISNARIVGLELETQARLTDELSLDANLNHFFQSELLEPAPAQPGGLMPQAGDKLPFNPEWSFNIGLDYRRAITADLDGSLRIDWSHTGDRITGFRPFTAAGAPFNGYYDFKAYDTVNVRAGVSSGPWRVQAFINNLMDARPVTQQRNFAPLPVVLRNTIKPRTIGLNITTNL